MDAVSKYNLVGANGWNWESIDDMKNRNYLLLTACHNALAMRFAREKEKAEAPQGKTWMSVREPPQR